MVIDRRNRVRDRRKASLSTHHDCQYLDITTFTNFKSFITFSKRILAKEQGKVLKGKPDGNFYVHVFTVGLIGLSL